MLHIPLLAILLLQGVAPPACQWTRGVEIGKVEAPIAEDSGLAVSRKYPDRLYHVNDSGDIGRFFTTDLSGKNWRVIHVNGFEPHDAEDLGLGYCGGAADCVFIADIGDNSRKRKHVEFVAIEEKETFSPLVDPKYRVRMRYPDAIYNAESFAVHTNGDIFILTKGGIPRLYRLRKDQWMSANGKVQTLEFVTAIDFMKLGGPEAFVDWNLPTAMDISSDGKRLLVLTYRTAFEFYFDIAQPLPPVAAWKAGRQYRRIDVEVLEQQEAVAYLPDALSFVYDTEKPQRGRARIMRVACIPGTGQ